MGNSIISRPNFIRGNPTDLSFIGQIQLKSEAFIGYLKADGPDGKEFFLICRNYTPTDLKPVHDRSFYASYLAPIGRLMATMPGDTHHLKLPGSIPGRTREVTFTVLQRNAFYSLRTNGTWDATRNDIGWIGGKRFVESLRKFDPAEVQLLQRAISDRVQLPDQAILDDAQDIIFREPLNRFLVISGAPGTGKTTVLIKRLAQKTKYEFLSDSEKRLVSANDWQENKNWVLFTPSDLLKNYLKESLGKEHLPATEDTVRVWSQYRDDLLRDLNFLKAGSNGYFNRMPPGQLLVKRTNSAEAVALAKAFREEFGRHLDRYYREEFTKFGERIRQPLAELRGGMQALMNRALDYLTGAIQGAEQQADPIRVGTEFRAKAQQLDELCRYVEGLASRGERQSATPLTVESVNQLTHQTTGSLKKLTSIAVPEHLFPNLKGEIEGLETRVKALMDSLGLGTVFARLPLFYHEFRTSEKYSARFFSEESLRSINERKIDAIESDALLWVALGFVTTHEGAVRELDRRNGNPSRAGMLLAQRQGMVTVDEATDFSAVELGCMKLLCDPTLESFTICGDPMQRLTTQGIQDWSEMSEITGPYSSTVLGRSYRQTARLLEVAIDLYRNFMDTNPPFASAYQLNAEDPPPLAFKSSEADAAEAWITERIIEIWETNGNKLPSIGVFVPESEDEAGWVKRLTERLYENAINVEGSGDGASLGNAHRVRVFPVSKIKGLEFEAAFFVDIDRMADKAPALVEKYLYVGLSRARSYLGVTYSSQFPRKLSCVRKHFVDRRSFTLGHLPETSPGV